MPEAAILDLRHKVDQLKTAMESGVNPPDLSTLEGIYRLSKALLQFGNEIPPIEFDYDTIDVSEYADDAPVPVPDEEEEEDPGPPLILYRGGRPSEPPPPPPPPLDLMPPSPRPPTPTPAHTPPPRKPPGPSSTSDTANHAVPALLFQASITDEDKIDLETIDPRVWREEELEELAGILNNQEPGYTKYALVAKKNKTCVLVVKKHKQREYKADVWDISNADRIDLRKFTGTLKGSVKAQTHTLTRLFRIRPIQKLLNHNTITGLVYARLVRTKGRTADELGLVMEDVHDVREFGDDFLKEKELPKNAEEAKALVKAMK
jgi:hypothetical protein